MVTDGSVESFVDTVWSFWLAVFGKDLFGKTVVRQTLFGKRCSATVVRQTLFGKDVFLLAGFAFIPGE